VHDRSSEKRGHSYGNGEALWLRYYKYGQLVRESDANTGADYRLVNETDARGNPAERCQSHFCVLRTCH
jgi:hypothetical protein